MVISVVPGWKALLVNFPQPLGTMGPAWGVVYKVVECG